MRRILATITVLLGFAPFLGAQRMLSLQECLDLCEERNPYVGNAKLDIEASEAMRSEALWAYFPEVNIVGMGYGSQNPLLKILPSDLLGTSDLAVELANRYLDFAYQNGLKTGYRSFQKGYLSGVTAIQPIYAGGRIVNGNRMAAVGVEAAELQADLKLRDTKEQIEGKYWLVVSLQEKFKTLQKAETVLDSLLSFAVTAKEAGLIPASDVSRIKLKRSELAAGKVQLRGGLKLAKMDLFNAIGLQYNYLELSDYVLSEEIGNCTGTDGLTGEETGIPVEARLLDIQQEAKKLEKKMSVGELLPQVGVGVSYGYHNLQGKSVGEMNGVGFVSVKIPITGIGKAVVRARRMDYEIQKVSNERAYLNEQLQLQQRQLFLAVEVASGKVDVSLEALAAAEEETRRCLADYEAGRATVAELLQVELDCRTASEKYIDDCIEYRKAVNAYRSRYCN